jgi:hypothetical protein
MLLNARDNLFQFGFPRTFIPKEVGDKYKQYLNRIPGNLIEEPIDFINYTIQSINLPGMGYDPIQQAQFPGRNYLYRSSVPVQELFQKEMTVTFQLVDGYINYWILLDTLTYYYNFSTEAPFVPDMNLRILDSEGNGLVTATIKKPLIKTISDLQMSFASNVAEFKTFDLSIAYNEFEVRVELD